MPALLSMLVLAALTAPPSASVAAAPPAVTIPAEPLLTDQIRKADTDLFSLFFESQCDVPRFRAMITDDIEFYHDKGGFNVRKPADFVAQYEERCKDNADPESWRTRRELVPESLHVDPIPGWGAMEVGDHLFYERHGATGDWKLVGKASFSMVWVLGSDGQWRVSRVLSYAHHPAG